MDARGATNLEAEDNVHLGTETTTAPIRNHGIRNMSAWAAVDYIIEEAVVGREFTEATKQFRGCHEFCLAAERGDLRVEGRPRFRAETLDISHTYWRVGQLALLKYAAYRSGRGDGSDGGETEQKRVDVVPSDFTIYVGLRVNEDEVRSIWPVANT